MPDLTPLSWFVAIAASGTVNALSTYFIQRFLVKPLDVKISDLTKTIQKFNTSRLSDNGIYRSQNRDAKSKVNKKKIGLKKIELQIDSWVDL
jgi:hypothetical protein